MFTSAVDIGPLRHRTLSTATRTAYCCQCPKLRAAYASSVCACVRVLACVRACIHALACVHTCLSVYMHLRARLSVLSCPALSCPVLPVLPALPSRPCLPCPAPPRPALPCLPEMPAFPPAYPPAYLPTYLPACLPACLRAGVCADRPVVVYGDWREGWGEEGRIYWMLQVANTAWWPTLLCHQHCMVVNTTWWSQHAAGRHIRARLMAHLRRICRITLAPHLPPQLLFHIGPCPLSCCST